MAWRAERFSYLIKPATSEQLKTALARTLSVPGSVSSVPLGVGAGRAWLAS